MKYNKKILMIVLAITCLILTCSKVKASTTLTFTTAQARLYLDNNGTEVTTGWYDNPHTFNNPAYPVKQIQYRFSYSGGFSKENQYTFKFSYQPTPDAIYDDTFWFSDGTNTLTDFSCTGFIRESNGYYANTCSITPTANISNSGYLYARVVFDGQYLTSIRTWNSTFEEHRGVQGTIVDQTNQLIDAQNQATEQIIDSVNNAMTSDCQNLLYIVEQITGGNGLTINNDNGIITTTGTIDTVGSKTYSQTFQLTSGTYYFNVDNVDSNLTWYLRNASDSTNVNPNTSFTITGTKNFFLSFRSNTLNQSINVTNKLSLFKTTNKSFCQYGTNKSKIDETNEILNSDKDYNNNASETINGQNDLNNLDNKDNQLRNSLNLDQTSTQNVTINANSSSYIWGIVDRLRAISTKIVLLMTSLLGLGVMKMILNR